MANKDWGSAKLSQAVHETTRLVPSQSLNQLRKIKQDFASSWKKKFSQNQLWNFKITESLKHASRPLSDKGMATKSAQQNLKRKKKCFQHFFVSPPSFSRFSLWEHLSSDTGTNERAFSTGEHRGQHFPPVKREVSPQKKENFLFLFLLWAEIWLLLEHQALPQFAQERVAPEHFARQLSWSGSPCERQFLLMRGFKTNMGHFQNVYLEKFPMQHRQTSRWNTPFPWPKKLQQKNHRQMEVAFPRSNFQTRFSLVYLFLLF